jgi:hypothetical protein
MRTAAALDHHLAGFELPPQFPVAERRLAGLALAQWRRDRHQPVAGYADNSILIAEPDGRPRVTVAGNAVAASFGLLPGAHLDAPGGLAAELRAACDLIAIDLMPVPFEANLPAPGGACILARGVALPIGPRMELVQVILSWREVLDRSATRRLRREIGAALRHSPRKTMQIDPFSPEMSR